MRIPSSQLGVNQHILVYERMPMCMYVCTSTYAFIHVRESTQAHTSPPTLLRIESFQDEISV
jgi:hypothetical protein